jgi:hypothetical protein
MANACDTHGEAGRSCGVSNRVSTGPLAPDEVQPQVTLFGGVTWGCRVPLPASGWGDLNSRPPAPKAVRAGEWDLRKQENPCSAASRQCRPGPDGHPGNVSVRACGARKMSLGRRAISSSRNGVLESYRGWAGRTSAVVRSLVELSDQTLRSDQPVRLIEDGSDLVPVLALATGRVQIDPQPVSEDPTR